MSLLCLLIMFSQINLPISMKLKKIYVTISMENKPKQNKLKVKTPAVTNKDKSPHVEVFLPS